MDEDLTTSPVISVVMPVYNSAKYLREAIDSVLNQTFGDFEFLIFDDGSKDESVAIIKSYNDPRIIPFFSAKNIGYVPHLNNGIKAAKGKYIARMDSDDICIPTRFEDQINCFKNDPQLGIVFGRTMMIDDHGNDVCESWRPKTLKSILRFLPYRTYIPHPSVMIKASLYAKYDFYKAEKAPAEDMDLWGRFHAGNERFFYLDKIILKYRLNPQSVQNVRGNAAYQPNYYFKLALDCFANDAKVKALFYGKTYWSQYAPKEKLTFISKLFIPFYFLVARGYLLSRNKLKQG